MKYFHCCLSCRLKLGDQIETPQMGTGNLVYIQRPIYIVVCLYDVKLLQHQLSLFVEFTQRCGTGFCNLVCNHCDLLMQFFDETCVCPTFHDERLVTFLNRDRFGYTASYVPHSVKFLLIIGVIFLVSKIFSYILIQVILLLFS